MRQGRCSRSLKIPKDLLTSDQISGGSLTPNITPPEAFFSPTVSSNLPPSIFRIPVQISRIIFFSKPLFLRCAKATWGNFRPVDNERVFRGGKGLGSNEEGGEERYLGRLRFFFPGEN